MHRSAASQYTVSAKGYRLLQGERGLRYWGVDAKKSQEIAFGKTGSRTPLLSTLNTPSQGSLVSLLPNVRKQVILPAPRKTQKKKTRLPAAGRFGGKVAGLLFLFFSIFFSSILFFLRRRSLSPLWPTGVRPVYPCAAARLSAPTPHAAHALVSSFTVSDFLATGLRQQTGWSGFLAVLRPSSRPRDCRRQVCAPLRENAPFQTREGGRALLIVSATKVPCTSSSLTQTALALGVFRPPR